MAPVTTGCVSWPREGKTSYEHELSWTKKRDQPTGWLIINTSKFCAKKKNKNLVRSNFIPGTSMLQAGLAGLAKNKIK